MAAPATRAWLSAIVLITLWAVLAWRLSILQQPTPASPIAITTEDQQLFTDALAAGLLTTDDNNLIQLLPADELLARQQRGEPVEERSKRLFKRLQHSLVGSAVRAELSRWNRSRLFAALRDNSAAVVGISQTGWQARNCDGARRALGGNVPEDYGFLHQGRLRPGFGPWQVAAGGGCVEFHNHFFANQPRELTLWLIGQPDNGLDIATVAPQKQRKGPACEHHDNALSASIMTLAASDWHDSGSDDAHRWDYPVTLRLQPTAYRGQRIAGLNIRLDQNSCQPIWYQPASRPARRAQRSYGLYSSDRVALLDAHGEPTPITRKLGLLPVVGFGRQDYHSLAGLLARSSIPSGGYDIKLTIDARLQQIAQTVLRDGVADLFPIDIDRYADQRRAALVAINARSGAIVAVAGLPQIAPSGSFQDWDLAAFARRYPAADPLRVRAWDSALDRNDAPGSTFKPVTALAAISKAETDPRVAAMLNGWSPKQFTEETGLVLNTSAYDPYSGSPNGSPDGRSRRLRNFRLADGRYETFQTLLHGKLRAPECPLDATATYSLGLPPAVRDSLNIWFARLAIMVDGRAMDELDLDIHPVPPPRFLQTLERLGMNQSLDLLADSPAFIAAGGHPELAPAKVSLEAKNPRPARWVLAQNAIGQGIAVTALHIARLAASIANGALVQPHLIANWNGHAVSTPKGAALPGDLNPLRSGMRAVPQVGTAKRAFRRQFAEHLDSPLRCNTWGKTGTAEVAPANGSGKARFNSAWFMGWHQPANGDPLAFACMVSHAYGVGARTGGQVCAPLVARFLAKAMPEPSPDANPTISPAAVVDGSAAATPPRARTAPTKGGQTPPPTSRQATTATDAPAAPATTTPPATEPTSGDTP